MSKIYIRKTNIRPLYPERLGVYSVKSGMCYPADLDTNLTIQSLAGFVYIQPALIVVPNMPKLFREDVDDEGDEIVPDKFLLARCELCELLYQILEYNYGINDNLGDDEDISWRLKFYDTALNRIEPLAQEPQSERIELARHLFLRYAVAQR
jgi:hypothetical protein